MRTCLPLVCSASLTLACSTDYAYQPETHASSPESGQAAAEYAIPPDAPCGDVRIASYGIVDVPAAANVAGRGHAVELSLQVTNNSGQDWALDVREQSLDLDVSGGNDVVVRPEATSPAPGVVTIPPGGQRVVDLRFPLPGGVSEAADLSAFRLQWRVTAGREIVAERTSFGRHLVPRPIKGW